MDFQIVLNCQIFVVTWITASHLKQDTKIILVALIFILSVPGSVAWIYFTMTEQEAASGGGLAYVLLPPWVAFATACAIGWGIIVKLVTGGFETSDPPAESGGASKFVVVMLAAAPSLLLSAPILTGT
ncbi:MAG: hypothetical protein AAFV19_00955 [Pseudomonadota bacterium]